ncbi:MAG: hypothetical protein M3P85_01980 [Actinomycetota bacterium]|nr:hypothetical protein [Actinomycetota bacterium]
MPDVVVFDSAGPDAAPVLALLWAQAEARRKGEPVLPEVDGAAIEGVRARLEQPGAVAVVATQGGRPVAGCFATQAVVDDEPAPAEHM